MSDPASPSNGDGTAAATPVVQPGHSFPVVRFFYAFGFGIVAWLVFWVAVVLGIVQFVVVAINGRVNEELRSFSASLIRYLWELLAYVTFVRDDQPFPIGPFPKS
ncbi:MAG: DUF4389 domain-containing protein [Alphaproteobacteria bacterium]|nr:DUF4389 domain-containing protein [Alphaproteobacteria bacterium]